MFEYTAEVANGFSFRCYKCQVHAAAPAIDDGIILTNLVVSYCPYRQWLSGGDGATWSFEVLAEEKPSNLDYNVHPFYVTPPQ